MQRFRQQFLADPVRGDGHTTEGVPGDCFRTALAVLLDIEPLKLKNCVQYLSWWAVARLETRATRGLDLSWTDKDDFRLEWVPDGAFLIGCGPSPRGNFWHSVVVDKQLNLVHDPHPSDAGLIAVCDVIWLVEPYDPAPKLLELVGNNE